ncbi:MAG TPA: lipoprotein insertase outer membrane protein LolB [Noviherbaspirillum sp.]|uniref:lipoprotein insertase outer membrane protein LolB n=1 Tax=Noviherbaspirillum sp. TaxID=1926288 RepID=UPI002B498D32|nr:lipoprotein insertase outer membrane protein LolB [Noviherbaspirillum sp.]HJV87972.1 lipoprotein insertase outer membrane protein LolB [Noviherbaspirillum sp.]
MNVRAARSALVIAALPLLFAGCASVQPATVSREGAVVVPADVKHAYYAAIDFTGRLSVHYQGPRNEEALHGSFLWAQTLTQTSVTLLSPLGQTIAIIDVTPDGASLRQGGQATRQASDVDALTVQTLGWPLPVAGLRDWLQGFAVNAQGQRFVATPQTSEVTTRDGWHIRYDNWQEDNTSGSQNRPKRIDLSRYTEQAGDVSIRIVIDSWQAH